MATNTISHQQKVDFAEFGMDEIPELIDHDTGKKSETNIEHYIRYNDELEMIPEESDEDLPVTVQGNGDEVDTILYIPGDLEDEQFNTAIDDTSDDPMIVMGKPLTTAFVLSNVHVPTKKVGCLQSQTKCKMMKNAKSYEPNNVGKKDVVIYKRVDCIPTKEKRPIETRDIDDDLMREYDEMYKSMEYKQIYDYYEAQRHIQSAMEGDTPIKTSHNRQCIDNVRDYDREHDRILNSVYHRLDLGPNMLPGAQHYTTVESATALSIQDKFKGKYDENTCNKNGQYRNELYKRAENMVPQLDCTYNVSDDSDTDSHSYLDLASSNIIAHRMRGQKQRHEIDTRAHTNRHLALKEGAKPNANIKM